MKSLLTEEEKLRIRSMHINEKYSLLKEEGEFFDLEPLDASTAKPAEQPAQGAAGGNTLGQSEVKAFQDWLDANKVDWDPANPKTNWIKLNKTGKGYGTNGPRTKAAWAKFMGEYNKSKTQ